MGPWLYGIPLVTIVAPRDRVGKWESAGWTRDACQLPGRIWMLSAGESASLSVRCPVPSFSPRFWALLLLSRINNVCCLPSHTPTKLFALLCLTHLLPPTVLRRCALAHTNQVPYHNCGTLTEVPAITQQFSLSSLFAGLEREAPPPHGEQPTKPTS